MIAYTCHFLASSEKQKLRNDINSTSQQDAHQNLRNERNQILSEILEKLQEEEENKLQSMIEEVEKNKNDCNKMYSAVRILRQNKQKKNLVVEGSDGIASCEAKQTEIITEYFTTVFAKENEKPMPDIEPKKMT